MADLRLGVNLKEDTDMNIWTILIIVLIIALVAGGRFGGPTPGTGYYPANYGYGGGGLLLVILLVWFFFFRGGSL